MYKIIFSDEALQDIRTLTKKNLAMYGRIENAISKLSYSPNHSGLRTHKVRTRKYGEHFSSRITGDIRMFWNYHSKNVIRIFTIADHSDY